MKSANVILKYKLAVTDRQELQIPAGAKLLTVQIQHGELFLWALTSGLNPPARVEISIYGTGNPISDNPGEYIGTVQTGIFVWHVFDTSAVLR